MPQNKIFVSGLDPAEGRWTYNDTATRLDISDADFVDIMHTNGGEISEGEIAFYEAIGHVDFYVNGGHKQPGCEDPDYSKSFLIKSLVQQVIKEKPSLNNRMPL